MQRRLPIGAALMLAVANDRVVAQTTTSTIVPSTSKAPSWLHPVCQKYGCVVSEDANTDFTLAVDPTACVVMPGNATTKPYVNPLCPSCLLGDPVFVPLLQRLGAGTVIRDKLKVVLMFDNWMPSVLDASITSILLREVMGFTSLRTSTQVWSEMDIVCCPDRTVMGLELWPFTTIENIVSPADNVSSNEVVVSGPLGETGYTALWVAGVTLTKMPLLGTFESLRLPEYLAQFPAAFSTPCEQLLVNDALGCVAGNYVCETSAWKNSGCDRGRFVPPQCNGTDPASGLPRANFCREILMVDPNWDSGFWEGLIVNTGLNFTLAYLGANRLPVYVMDQTAKGIPQIFDWASPDTLLEVLNAQRVRFHPSTKTCLRKYSPEPTLNAADCDYPQTPLVKSVRKRDTELEPDLAYLVKQIQFSDDDILQMLFQHVIGGGTMQASEIACGWLKNNTNIWSDWVRNTPNAVDPAAAQRLLTTQIGASVGGVVGALLLFAIGAIVLLRLQAVRRNKAAPTATPFAIVFTDIQSSSALWEAYPDAMGVAVEQHHAVMRQAIEDFGAYEIKTVGDSFMIAVGSTEDAILMAVEIQTMLMQVKWPQALLDPYDTLALPHQASPIQVSSPSPLPATTSSAADEQPPKYRRYLSSVGLNDHVNFSNEDNNNNGNGASVWCGLRVRIGVHHCEEATAKLDAITGRYDYYGHDVNVAARIEATAQGGQVLVDKGTLDVLPRAVRFQLQADCCVQRYVQNFELKGISTPMTLYSVLPQDLQNRAFKLPDGYVEPDHTEDTPTPTEHNDDKDPPRKASSGVANSSSTCQSDREHGSSSTSSESGRVEDIYLPIPGKRSLYEVAKGALEEILKSFDDRRQTEPVLVALLKGIPGLDVNHGKSYARKRQRAAVALAERLAAAGFGNRRPSVPGEEMMNAECGPQQQRNQHRSSSAHDPQSPGPTGTGLMTFLESSGGPANAPQRSGVPNFLDSRSSVGEPPVMTSCS